jgi:DNA polymerase III subunit alpha
MENYVSLHNHTCHSLMHSLIKPNDLFAKVKELQQPAVGVTDSSTMFATWDAYKASQKTGVKLITGCEFFFTEDMEDENSQLTHLVLLAKNHKGYKNLLLALKLANENFVIRYGKVIPRIDWNILEKCSKGIIVLTACGEGLLSYYINTRRSEEAFKRAKKLKDIFGENLALEIQPHAMIRQASPFNDYEDQTLVNNKLIKFGQQLDIKVVATCDAHYLEKDDWEAQDALVAIGSGVPVRTRFRLQYTAHDFYLKTRDEIVKFFQRKGYANAEEFCDNTVFFADMCEEPDWIDPKYSNPSGAELPSFPVKDQPDYQQFLNWLSNKDNLTNKPEDDNYLRYCCENSLNKINKNQDQEYLDRVEKELDTFEFRNLASYMLIVADYVNWAKNNNLPTGPGRGSAGGSLVAYLLGIHDADSIKYGLIFERFYNKTKTGFSDIDCDFGQSAKPLVQKYIENKYGSDYVAHISNINTITPKVYARDLARAFEFGGSRESAVEIGTAIADSISDDCKTIKGALVNAPLFQEFAEVTEYAPLKKFASLLEGLPRAQATHAGGIVIGKRPLYEIVPIRKDKEAEWVLEYEKDRAEDNGLVKMDVLGVSTLDIIEKTLQIIKSREKEIPSLPWDYDKNDKKAYELIGRGDTYGVFQLGTSAGTKDLCIKMKPKNIEDLAMINSMARPGFPKEVIKEFMLTKHKGVVANLIHPILKNSLSQTFGYALFDEVLLQLANDVAGWDLAEADRLRKFIKEKGKYPEKDQKLKEDFIDGAINNKKLSEEEANLIWDKVVGNFGAYLFNKSHAVTYSFISYQTAYLKAHYPAEFLTANLIFEDSSGAKVADKNKKILKREIRSLGINVLPPDVNKSDNVYKILDNNSILTGFSSLKYMGTDAIPELLAKRPYSSFEELLSKTDGKKVRITSIQALAASGALDSFGLTRKQMFLYASDYRKKLQAWQKRKTDKPFNYPWPEDIGEWSISEKYAMEVYYLGEAFCCGIKEAYGDFFDNWALDFSKLPDIFPDPGDSTVRYELSTSDGIVEGVITDYFEFKVKNEKSKIFGEIMAKISLEDIYGNIISMTLFPSGLEHLNDRLRALTGSKIALDIGTALKITASANWYDGDISLVFGDLIAAAPLPSKPKELKHQKVTMRVVKKNKKKTNKLNPDEFLNQVEDEMIFEGYSDDID